MSLRIYFCQGTLNEKPCPNKEMGFVSRRDPNARLVRNRPQFYLCGERVTAVDSIE